MSEPRAAPIVEVLDVGKTYPAGDETLQALAGVSLTLAPGELVALMGPSGGGKSTLLNLIACLDVPTSGEIRIAGQSIAALSDDGLTYLRRHRVGMVFQAFNLLPSLTLAENVALPLVLLRRSRAEIGRAVDAALARVGLANRAQARPGEVSGGQQQRAALARATIHCPAVLLADEPTGNLDSQNGSIVLDLLRSYADAGQAMLMATHSEEAAARCDRRLILRDGRLSEVART